MSDHTPVEPSRITVLTENEPDQNGSYVLYWMQNSVRTRHNPALEHAAHLSNQLQKPLRVTYVLDQVAQDTTQLTERHASFLIDGLRDVSEAMEKRNIPFAVAAPPGNVVSALVELADAAAIVVTDKAYLRPGVVTRQAASKRLRVPLVVVEADVVVPVEVASQKAEHAARTIRPKITRLLPEYLNPLTPCKLEYQEKCDIAEWLRMLDLRMVDLNKREQLLSSLDLDRGAPVVKTFQGGQDQAQQVLKNFLGERLPGYGAGRNEPARGLQSDLSPYLRAGNISPVDIALCTKLATKGKSGLRESEASFLEELIVRRELAVNACWFNPKYDDYESIVPRFAQESLAIHKEDKRPKIYSYEELEAAVTGDAYWNAAQLEMIVRGKMHGYMRMYWAKQILGWVADPKDAMDYAIRLNNRWELDAVDPNSYAGVIWCFGLHDQGWRERAIWGKVRYMNDSGLKRKFNMAAYVAMVDKMVAREGLPQHIAQLRKGYKSSGRQQTIQEALKRGSKTTKTTGKRPQKKTESIVKSAKKIKS